jgi:hypothetical protein
LRPTEIPVRAGVIVVSVAPLLLLNYNASRLYQQSWMEKTSLELATLAGDRRALIDRFPESREDPLAGFMFLSGPQTPSEGKRLAAVLQARNRSGVVTDPWIIDRNGNRLACQGRYHRPAWI